MNNDHHTKLNKLCHPEGIIQSDNTASFNSFTHELIQNLWRQFESTEKQHKWEFGQPDNGNHN